MEDTYNITESSPYTATLRPDNDSAKLISGLKQNDRYELQITSVHTFNPMTVAQQQNCYFSENGLTTLSGNIGDASVNTSIQCQTMRTFFRFNDGVHGNELWVTDGTADGSRLVKDIKISGDASPGSLTVFGDKLFFTASEDTHGQELWVTDGTSDGTYLIEDIRLGTGSASPYQLTPVGDKLFFKASDDTHGQELWVTDGTKEGTRLIEDIQPGSNDSNLD
ncbi:ELWxxDGT repeat protein, partial [Oceanospirillum sp. HFRX-1_2]